MRPEFYELPFVRFLTDDFIESQDADKQAQYIEQLRTQLCSLIVHTSHGDHVAVLPSGAVNLGYSDRTENELWVFKDRVFAL